MIPNFRDEVTSVVMLIISLNKDDPVALRILYFVN